MQHGQRRQRRRFDFAMESCPEYHHALVDASWDGNLEDVQALLLDELCDPGTSWASRNGFAKVEGAIHEQDAVDSRHEHACRAGVDGDPR